MIRIIIAIQASKTLSGSFMLLQDWDLGEDKWVWDWGVITFSGAPQLPPRFPMLPNLTPCRAFASRHVPGQPISESSLTGPVLTEVGLCRGLS